MPIHDWSKMLDGDFHDFHQSWIIELRNALNRGLLPDGFMAMSDQVTGGPIPHVVSLRTKSRSDSGGLAVKPAPPSAQMIAKFERQTYAERADRIVIRHGRGEVIAIIEIVSPGSKHNNAAIRKFIHKSLEFMDQGIHMLIVDLHPPTKRDPNGLQQAIAEEQYDMKFELPPGKNRTAGSYFNGELPAVYLESFGIGDVLPSLPIFLTEEDYIPAPLEETYMRAWQDFPKDLRAEMEKPNS
jgi:hypothetical protein